MNIDEDFGDGFIDFCHYLMIMCYVLSWTFMCRYLYKLIYNLLPNVGLINENKLIKLVKWIVEVFFDICIENVGLTV